MVAQAKRNTLRSNMLILFVLVLPALAVAASGHVSLAPGASDDTPRWRVLSADADGLRLEFSLDAFGVEELREAGETWRALSIEGGTVQGEEGAPALPTAGRLVAVPSGVVVTGRVIGFETVSLPSLRLHPIQPGRGGDFIVDREAYDRAGMRRLAVAADKRAAAAPDAPVVLVGAPAVMAGQTVVPVTVSPLAYDAAVREGLAARTIEIELSFVGGASPKAARPVPASFDAWMGENVSNYDIAKSAAVLPGTYAIVRHGDAAVADSTAVLEDWRRRQGYHVEVVDIDVVGNNTSSIKSALQALYDDTSIPPLEFVTLIGDEDGAYNTPTWTESLSGYGGPGDHYYVTLDGGDVLADAHIGRLSFETLDQLGIIIDKIIGYEQSPPMGDTSWYGRACLQGDESASGITTIYVNQWLKGHLEVLGWAQVDTTWSGNFQTAFSSRVGDGVSIYGYRGYLGMSNIGQSTIGNLSNGGMLPVAILPTCDTGTITHNECRSESFLRAANGGGIAAVGTATQGTHTRYNNCYYHGIWNGLLYNDDHRVGVAHSLGKVELYNNYQVAEPSRVEIWSVWNSLMGDPATDPWLGVPAYLGVDHPASLAPGATAVPVSVTSGGLPAEGLVVCVFRDGAFQVSGVTDASGEVALAVPALTSGTVLVTVHGHGHIPYLGSLSVGAADVFCGLDDVTIGGDGALNPGETVDLDVALRNLGGDPATGVSATLGGGGAYGAVVSGALSFGDIGAGAAAWSSAPSQVSVSADAPDGEAIDWTLVATDGVDTWTSVIETVVQAADLSIDAFAWSGPGGDPDPGESGGVVLDLANDGSLAASGVTATLTTESPWITVSVGTAGFGDIATGVTGDNAGAPFELNVSPDCYQGHLATLVFTIDYSGGMQAVVEQVVSVGTAADDAPLGPDMYGYYAYDDTDVGSGHAPVYDWVAIDPDHGGAGTDVGLSDFGWEQDDTETIDLPFDFRYYGVDYDRVSICSNGWLAMGETSLRHYRNWGIPSAGSPGAMIAPFWDNLYQAGSYRVYTWHDTTEHRFVVQWYDVRNDYSNATQNFEVILYDPSWHQTATGDGMILFQYETVGNTDGRDGYATVGIQNAERTDGLMYTFWNEYADAAAPLATGRAILFMPLGEVLHPAAAVTPGTLDAGTTPGGQVVEYVHIANTGEIGSQLNYTVSKVDPATVPAGKRLPGDDELPVVPMNLTGSDVKLNATEYEAGTTVVLDVAATCLSNDQEWLVFVSMDFPAGVSVVSAGGLSTNHGTMDWNGATGDGVVSTWGDGTAGGGFLDNGETGHATITLDFDAGLVGDVEIDWLVYGDDWGDPPHQIEGKIILVATAPAIHVTAPNVGDVAVLGETIDLTYLAVNGPEFLTIELQRAEGGPWQTLATGVSASAGTWPWTVSGDPGPWAVFRVTDESDPMVSGESGVFAVGRNLDWVQLTDGTGSVTAGASSDVTVTLDATGLSEGVHEANLNVEHNGGARVVVPVTFTVSSGTSVDDGPPSRVTLLGAHPNPFNPQTVIGFALPFEMPVELKVYSAEGKLVRTLLGGRQRAGTHRVLWDGRDGSGYTVSSGVYLYRLTTSEGALSGKVALLK